MKAEEGAVGREGEIVAPGRSMRRTPDRRLWMVPRSTQPRLEKEAPGSMTTVFRAETRLDSRQWSAWDQNMNCVSFLLKRGQ